MPGLIPLVLGATSPCTRSSVSIVPLSAQYETTSPSPSSLAPPSPNSTTHLPRPRRSHRRVASDVGPSSRLRSPPPTPSRVPTPKLPQRTPQHHPKATSPVPKSPAEWKKAIADVKRFHATRKYRACSSKCNEILSQIAPDSQVEPAYLIYLNFAAAVALDICARPLLPSSSYRATLLQQARDHYRRATELIEQAENHITGCTRPASAASFFRRGDNAHRPSNQDRRQVSISSLRAWAPTLPSLSSLPENSLDEDSLYDVSSPPQSAFSPSSAFRSARSSSTGREKKDKKVSFELPKSELKKINLGWSGVTIVEPVIRPDSPTLGFQDDYFLHAVQRQELPELPLHTAKVPHSSLLLRPSPSISLPDMLEVPARVVSPSLTDDCSSFASGSDDDFPGTFDAMASTFISPSSASRKSSTSSIESTPDLGVVSAPIMRYVETLSHLKTQLASHLASLDELDAQTKVGGPTADLPYRSASSLERAFSPIGVQRRDARVISAVRRGSENITEVERPSSKLGWYGAGTSDEGQQARLVEDRRARIDRLRMVGWQRKRFDPSRYEQLCESVMAELA